MKEYDNLSDFGKCVVDAKGKALAAAGISQTDADKKRDVEQIDYLVSTTNFSGAPRRSPATVSCMRTHEIPETTSDDELKKRARKPRPQR